MTNGNSSDGFIPREHFPSHGELRVWVQAWNQHDSVKSQDVVFNTEYISESTLHIFSQMQTSLKTIPDTFWMIRVIIISCFGLQLIFKVYFDPSNISNGKVIEYLSDLSHSLILSSHATTSYILIKSSGSFRGSLEHYL